MMADECHFLWATHSESHCRGRCRFNSWPRPIGLKWWMLKSAIADVPSDTELLLTKNYFEKINFEKLRISRVISGKSHSFPEILRVQIPSKITKNNSRGIIFVIISCQRVIVGMEELELHCWWRGRSKFRKSRVATIRFMAGLLSLPLMWPLALEFL